MNTKLLNIGAKHFGINLSSDEEEKFEKYLHLLLDWNEKVNLTAITDPDEVVSKHFIDSLSCQSLIPNGSSIIDVGTGAGFPGIPLKIVRSDLNVTLLDSLNKRVSFLDAVVSETNLTNIKTVHGRAEDAGQNPLYREKFDVATARAVANLAVLSEYCLPFVKLGGLFIALKGRDAKNEADAGVKAIKLMGGELIELREVFWSDMEHTLAIIKKVKNTPQKYPRKAGKPTKEPII